MRLFIIRHGQSKNNVLMAEINGRRARGMISSAEAEEEWLRVREDDPPLTAEGLKEAQQLAQFYSRVFFEVGTRLQIMPSPFLRTCQTCEPLARSMGDLAKVVVNADIFENGGVYKAGRDAHGNTLRIAPGECMSAADIRRLFPGFDTTKLPSEGPWYTSSYEDEASAAARAVRVANWLKSSTLQKQVGDDILVLVMHGGFIDVLIKALLGLSSSEGGVAGGAEFSDPTSGVSIPFPNTATALLELHAAAVTVRWLGRVDHLSKGIQPALAAFAKL